MKKLLEFVKTYFALIVVTVSVAWSTIVVIGFQAKQKESGVTEIRIGHWQLEPGVREGLQKLARDYQKLHPNVRVVLDNIPGSAYGQWLNSQLLGNTAPDLVEIARGGMSLPPSVWLTLQTRYIVPVTSIVLQPNPYNKGTELEGVPLRLTCENGMQPSYTEELQEFMSMQISQVNYRVLYNKDLLKKLTGLESMPLNYREFLAVCDEIKKHKDSRGRTYIPIAGSNEGHFGAWDERVCTPMTYSALRRCDFNRDGSIDETEVLLAFQNKLLNFNYAPFQARFKMVHELTPCFQSGYSGVGGDDALFLFAQQRAVFISAGTFDAQGIINQAKGHFELGISKFPIPSRDDPEFGKFIKGPFYDSQTGAFALGLTRCSKNPEVALDFLLFLLGQKQNAELNGIMGWLPIVKGAQPTKWLSQFDPQTEGMSDTMRYITQNGGEVTIKWEQLYTLYQLNQISVTDLSSEFEKFFLQKAPKNYKEDRMRDWKRSLLRNEHMLASLRYRARHGTSEEQDMNWIKYRTITWTRAISAEISQSRVSQWVEQGPEAHLKIPYEYSDHALENIRNRWNADPGMIKQMTRVE